MLSVLIIQSPVPFVPQAICVRKQREEIPTEATLPDSKTWGLSVLICRPQGTKPEVWDGGGGAGSWVCRQVFRLSVSIHTCRHVTPHHFTCVHARCACVHFPLHQFTGICAQMCTISCRLTRCKQINMNVCIHRHRLPETCERAITVLPEAGLRNFFLPHPATEFHCELGLPWLLQLRIGSDWAERRVALAKLSHFQGGLLVERQRGIQIQSPPNTTVV